MKNLWILTEEKPKCSVIFDILRLYCKDFYGEFETVGEILVENELKVLTENQGLKSNRILRIKPIFQCGVFSFTYIVEGLKIKNIENVYIKTVSGSSSFFDFLVFRQKNEPINGQTENMLMAIEETKTNDDESRNTAIYQRSSKFVFIDAYNTQAKTYMLYNSSLGGRTEKKPSDTSIFGTNMLLTLGIDIIGKGIEKWFRPFESIEDLAMFKSQMRKPPAGNVPIDISVFEDRIEVSGRLEKPAGKGNIGHDPNIGALSIISKCIRHLGWKGKIIITKHGVTQEYINKTKGKNKFLYICKILDITLQGIEMPKESVLPESYWHYEVSSEKMASILLHMVGEYFELKEVYQNHAGCERGYFITPQKGLIALPKKDKYDVNLYIPDLVLYSESVNEVLLIEGKQLKTIDDGIEEIELYDSIENEFIKTHYEGATVERWLSIFGGNSNIEDLHESVLLYLKSSGEVELSNNAPKYICDMFEEIKK